MNGGDTPFGRPWSARGVGRLPSSNDGSLRATLDWSSRIPFIDGNIVDLEQARRDLRRNALPVRAHVLYTGAWRATILGQIPAGVGNGGDDSGSGGGGGSGGSSNEPPRDDGMEQRVKALEEGFRKIEVKLDLLVERSSSTSERLASIDAKLDAKAGVAELGKVDTRLAVIETKLDAKASQSDLSEIKGKIDKFVDKWFVLRASFGIVGAVAAFITAVNLFQNQIKAALGIH